MLLPKRELKLTEKNIWLKLFMRAINILVDCCIIIPSLKRVLHKAIGVDGTMIMVL